MYYNVSYERKFKLRVAKDWKDYEITEVKKVVATGKI